MAQQAGLAKPNDESSERQHLVERIASLQLPSDLHNKPNSDTKQRLLPKNVFWGLTAACSC